MQNSEKGDYTLTTWPNSSNMRVLRGKQDMKIVGNILAKDRGLAHSLRKVRSISDFSSHDFDLPQPGFAVKTLPLRTAGWFSWLTFSG